MSALRTPIRGLLQGIIHHTARSLDEQELARSSIVFAPHFDDETLGCGGTIIKKKAVGADVRIVFMTDGTASHSGLLPTDTLAEMRTREGLAAARVLGVEPHDVFLLGFVDSRLGVQYDAAERRVAEILRECRPQTVFIPYRHDQLADHVATNGIVSSALRCCKHDVIVYEYPIWFWEHWPWLKSQHCAEESLLRMLKAGWRADLRLLREPRCRIRVADVNWRKRAALEKHRSQTLRLRSDVDWPVLGDVWDGDFLECFFLEYELFVRKTRWAGTQRVREERRMRRVSCESCAQ
ncbi:MAG: PIG-L deacetylase family protein [Phycisphaerae bacterium]